VPTLRVAGHAGYGVVFAVVVLVAVFITNVPIRGLWSVILVVTLVLGTVILALADWWDDVFEAAVHSRVYIDAFGYPAISVPLLVLWLVVVLLFDRKSYMVFAPGQLLVHLEIGSGEVAYDTHGMVVAKRRACGTRTARTASASWETPAVVGFVSSAFTAQMRIHPRAATAIGKKILPAPARAKAPVTVGADSAPHDRGLGRRTGRERDLANVKSPTSRPNR
jgi:hypothetical protein